MDGLVCDACSKSLLINEDVRYEVKIEVKAAYDPMELTEDDLKKNHEKEIQQLLDKMKDMDPQEAQDQVYKVFKFDLCPGCQKKYIKDPLHRNL